MFIKRNNHDLIYFYLVNLQEKLVDSTKLLCIVSLVTHLLSGQS